MSHNESMSVRLNQPAADYQLIKWIDVFALLTNWSAQWNNRVIIIVQRLLPVFKQSDLSDGSRRWAGSGRALCIRRTLCRHVTIGTPMVIFVVLTVLTIFDDWYNVGTVLVNLWRLVHQWSFCCFDCLLTVFDDWYTAGTLVYQDCANRVPTVLQCTKIDTMFTPLSKNIRPTHRCNFEWPWTSWSDLQNFS